jgi:hypothetical protein
LSSYRTAWPSGAELVVKMQRRQLEGDVEDRGGIGREAAGEDIEIGQPTGIKFCVNDPASSPSQALSRASANSPTMVRRATFRCPRGTCVDAPGTQGFFHVSTSINFLGKCERAHTR